MKGTFFYLLQKYTEFNPHSDMDIGITRCSDGTPHNNILCSSPTPSWSGSKSTALQYEYSMRQTQMATWRDRTVFKWSISCCFLLHTVLPSPEEYTTPSYKGMPVEIDRPVTAQQVHEQTLVWLFAQLLLLFELHSRPYQEACVV